MTMTRGKRGRPRRAAIIPLEQTAVVGVNIRILRQRRGWTQAKLGALMGWPSATTVCAAEGRRGCRPRDFTVREVERLATIFGVSPGELTTRCANCQGQPPAGFACLVCCGATSGSDLLRVMKKSELPATVTVKPDKTRNNLVTTRCST
jgi:hypothetical protein